jgi:ADP-heptose:LPS heptosyltransferase
MHPKILLLAHDNKIGDSIILTGLLNAIVKVWPNAAIGILCGDTNLVLYKNHPNVKWLHVSPSRSILIRAYASLIARFKKYDYLVYFGLDVNKSSFKKISSLINAKQRILFANPIIKNTSDIVLEGPWSNCHISNRHFTFLRWIGSKIKHYHYDIKLNKNTERIAKNELGKSELSKNIIINGRGSSKDKCLSDEWISQLIISLRKYYPKHQFLILSTSKKNELSLSDKYSKIDGNLKIVPYKDSIDSNLAKRYEDCFLRPLDIVLIVKGSVGKIGLVPFEVPAPGNGGWVAGQSAIVLRVHPEYCAQSLFVQLRSQMGQALLDSIVSGATIKLIQLRELMKLEIVKSTPEQDGKSRKIIDAEDDLEKQIKEIKKDQEELSRNIWDFL